MKYKTAFHCTRTELANVLRAIADAVEGKGSDTYPLPKTDSFRKLKLAVKDEGDRCLVSFATKDDDDLFCSECGSSPVVDTSYKHLKKRMQATFRTLLTAARNGTMPQQATVDLFVEDSHTMISFSGYGDEFYNDYMDAVHSLEAACKQGDTATASAAVEELNRQKSACHARYK
ncbi:GAK system XXXCH domain-containing protein [Oleidesulfovibrio sp.]|uniref:GAK system XXXCH domain-containing protein n=1 Tax=Oleidesulfovibrio sp. TaxID=2909707 RepID=UPI003A8AFDEA